MGKYGITRERFLKALSEVRGNVRVTSDNPEVTYDTLEKYGYDLVERARTQKLDPVIGRDSEIRNAIRILSRKTKNNPVLVGEAGVGKSSVVEGFAQRLILKIYFVLISIYQQLNLYLFQNHIANHYIHLKNDFQTYHQNLFFYLIL